MVSDFLQLLCLVRMDFDIKKSLTEGFLHSGALNHCLQLWTLSWSYPLSQWSGYETSPLYQPPTFQRLLKSYYIRLIYPSVN